MKTVKQIEYLLDNVFNCDEIKEDILRYIKAFNFIKDLIEVYEYQKDSYCIIETNSDNNIYLCEISKEEYDMLLKVGVKELKS